MATSMNYSVVARKNPSKKSEPAKYYALAQASGELDFDEMCEAITGRTTCTETDVRAALSGWEIWDLCRWASAVRAQKRRKISRYP